MRDTDDKIQMINDTIEWCISEKDKVVKSIISKGHSTPAEINKLKTLQNKARYERLELERLTENL